MNVLAISVVVLAAAGAAWARPERDCYGASVQLDLIPPSGGGATQAAPAAQIFGYPAAFGARLAAAATPPLRLEAADPGDACGGAALRPASAPAAAALVARGNCSFVAKAAAVEAAGYAAMILFDPGSDGCSVAGAGANDSAAAAAVGIPLAYVTSTAADGPLADLIASKGSLALAMPPRSAFDWSEAALWAAAVGAVAVGALWAGAAGLHDGVALPVVGGGTAPAAEEDAGVVTARAAAAFVFVASAALLLMFLLLSRLLVIALTAAFAFIAWQSAALALATLLRVAAPGRRVDPLAVGAASAATAGWLALAFTGSHWAWAPQDALNFCLCAAALRAVRLPSLRVAAILLGAALVYDVWWVFLQPLVIGGPSVMVEVATGGAADGWRLPIVFAVPEVGGLGTNPALAMLGLGDVVLPGLLVGMARRWDVGKGRRGAGGYFLPLLAAYGGGLALTFVALARGWGGDQGQPALLYLSPATVGVAAALAAARGDLPEMWRWEEKGEGAPEAQGGDAASGRDVERADDEAAPLLEP